MTRPPPGACGSRNSEFPGVFYSKAFTDALNPPSLSLKIESIPASPRRLGGWRPLGCPHADSSVRTTWGFLPLQVLLPAPPPGFRSLGWGGSQHQHFEMFPPQSEGQLCFGPPDSRPLTCPLPRRGVSPAGSVGAARIGTGGRRAGEHGSY